ncbi:MAG TPA: cytochrome c3 family protein [Pyrinomonadaceae bacterium]|nr:cytochrome c3 family protein [Pyrinomonadaceae bacterium]
MVQHPFGKFILSFATIATAIFLIAFEGASQSGTHLTGLTNNLGTNGQDAVKVPDTMVLSEKAALGKVTFSHLNHTTKNYNIEGMRPSQCIECHHVEQPEAEAKKMLPHLTAYPPDRTTTLTAELLAKEPGTKVTPCRHCHARKEEKPTLWPEIPQIKSENSTAIITVTNQQAFHRACAGCHDQVVKARPEVKTAPTTLKCTACHKKA